MKAITSRLSFRITVSIVLIWLGLSLFLYLAVRSTVAKFYFSTIQEDMQWVSRATLNILSSELDKLIKSGHAEDPIYIKIFQNRAVLQAENFLRDYKAYGVIRRDEDNIFSSPGLPTPPAELIASVTADNLVVPVHSKTGLYYAYSVRFAPWEWRFFLVRPAESYGAFQGRLKSAYLAAGIALALAILVIIYLIYVSINMPINRIISSLREGKKPNYRGVFEPEYLSDSIRSMMESLELLNKNLEDKIKELTAQGEARKRLEEQLLQSQKMEAIGQLAGGIAHDFNNILTAVIGYANLIRTRSKEDAQIQTYADQILTASTRAKNLTKNLLTFSRKQVMISAPVDINEIIANIEKMLARLIREDIELKVSLADEALTILADTGQIEQVLINLATNARDAMPQGGALTIETSLVNIDGKYADSHFFAQPGKYACISVMDTGTGMDTKTQEKIFEPFFTTKEVGKGTGLGLSTAYGIIKQHNGIINVYSEPGIGTTFRIYFPMAEAKPEEARPQELPEPRGGAETILLAEDDADVRGLTKTILADAGYTVLEAVDGEDAIKVFSEHRDAVQLVILDVIMPKMNGKEAHNWIKKTSPETKVLFMSGYSVDIIFKKGVLEEGLNLISKPAVPHELLEKVRELLDKQGEHDKKP